MALDFWENKILSNAVAITAVEAGLSSATLNITDLAGTGRTTETVKGNADDISDLAGVGRTTETVKTNADNIATNTADLANIALQTKAMINKNMVYPSLIKNPGVLLEGFQNTADWTPTNGIISEDTVHYKVGTKGVKLTSTTTTASMLKTISISDLADILTKGLWVNVEDGAAVSYIRLDISSSSSYTSKNFTFSTSSKTTMKTGDNLIHFHVDEMTNTGGELWSNPFIRVRLVVSSKTGYLAVVTFMALYKNLITQPRALLTHDDFYGGVITYVDPLLTNLGIHYTVYAVGNQMGTAGYPTWIDCDHIYNSGNDVSNHSETHVHMGSLSYAECVTELQTNQNRLLARGYTRSAKHIAWPYGESSDNAIQAANDIGAISARGSSATETQSEPPLGYVYKLRGIGVNKATTEADIDAWIAMALRRGSALIFYIHNVLENPVNDVDCSYTIYRYLVEALINNGIPLDSISEFVTLATAV
jgi:peptidoglycan/xylan/chitin deacetylase (PgdA/CDA1 family)